MKMLIVILDDDNVESLLRSLTAESLRVTRIASTGGFFRKGSSTLLMGLEDDKVDTALKILRERIVPDHHATLFVVPVTRYEQI
ncbi:MAG: hypothetical protein Fur0035_21840 [Anaerolineales bacterium]